jgi:hypothetical protein
MTGAEPVPADPSPRSETFEFRFSRSYAVAALPFGVTPMTTSLVVTSQELRIRFGPWSADVPRSTVAGAEVTGPYQLAKVIGPPHLSLADRGITFATNRRQGVCIRLTQPVKAIEPLGLLRHPSITVTVEDPRALADALAA